MHREFKTLLRDARGESNHVIAVNLDIRGFSSFSNKVESADAAMFIKTVHLKLIENYFPYASFFKPTGDGLLLAISYDERSLKRVVRKTIDTCLRVSKEFCTFRENVPMINFKTPDNIGIGLSRGPACRLFSGDKTLDYLGRVLNLASRLMDAARPSGIVFNEGLGVSLLTAEQAALFDTDEIYVKGIAETEPLRIWYTKDLTKISLLYKQPLRDSELTIVQRTMKMKIIRNSPEWFRIQLPAQPVDQQDIEIIVGYPSPKRNLNKLGQKVKFRFHDFRYLLEAGKPGLLMNFSELANILKASEVKDESEIEINISYLKR